MTRKQKAEPKICRFPKCKNKATSRWNCPTCRKAVEGMIARGETTEALLIEKGWVSPPKKKGRPAKSAAALAVAMLK
jgi:hypothetical protein